MAENMQSIQHEKCGRCSRRLKDLKSRERGFGPCCWKKYQAAKAEEEFQKNQLQLELQAVS